MITLLIVLSAIAAALFVGLLAGAGMTLAVHQREFEIYKADMQAMLDSRDAAMAQLCHAVQSGHQDVEALLIQTGELSAMNARIVSALCQSSAGEAFAVVGSARKH